MKFRAMGQIEHIKKRKFNVAAIEMKKEGTI